MNYSPNFLKYPYGDEHLKIRDHKYFASYPGNFTNFSRTRFFSCTASR